VFGGARSRHTLGAEPKPTEKRTAGKTAKGAIAQLGERLHGMQEVSGSIPLGSTNPVISNKINKLSGFVLTPCPTLLTPFELVAWVSLVVPPIEPLYHLCASSAAGSRGIFAPVVPLSTNSFIRWYAVPGADD
jgi:hypothetical protein